MLCLSKTRRTLLLSALLIVFLSGGATAQDDPNDTPLGDVARSLRKKTPSSQKVIDDDNFSQVMDQAESKHTAGSALKFLMSGESKGFQVSAPDVTCSLSFTANAKSLLSSQYAQMDLPSSEVLKLEGPATIEGDALTVSVFNNTNWHVSEVTVAFTVVRKKGESDPAFSDGIGPNVSSPQPVVDESSVRPEKKPDVVVLYRMRAAAPPWSRAVFSAPLDQDVSPGEEWHWAIVQAKGYPPQTGADKTSQTAKANDAMPQQPQLPAAQEIPQSLSADPALQSPR